MVHEPRIAYDEPKWAHEEVMAIVHKWVAEDTDLDVSAYIYLHASEELKEEKKRAEKCREMCRRKLDA